MPRSDLSLKEETERPLLRLFLSSPALFVPRFMLKERGMGRAIRRLASELLNGAICAALVAGATGIASADKQMPLAGPFQQAADQPSSQAAIGAAGRKSFAVPSLAGSLPERTGEEGDAKPAAGNSAPASDQLNEEAAQAAAEVLPGAGSQAPQLRPRESGEPVTASVQESPSRSPPTERALEAAGGIDAVVPPIRRQRPVTPPLVFNVPGEKRAKSSSRKPDKAQVKRSRSKGQEPARSALGAGSRAK